MRYPGAPSTCSPHANVPHSPVSATSAGPRMREITSDVVPRVLGPALIADTGEWGTYEWGEHVLGAPGYRIAGGSDEVQRNIIGERVLGLPAEPRVDKDTPFKDVLR